MLKQVRITPNVAYTQRVLLRTLKMWPGDLWLRHKTAEWLLMRLQAQATGGEFWVAEPERGNR